MIRVVRLGSPRAKGEGVRIGTVRRPPRGVKKSEYASRDFYDVWLPELSPSPIVVANWLDAGDDEVEQARYARRFRHELKAQTHLIELLVALSHRTNFSVGCYCEREERCHRSVLRAVLKERGAAVTPPAGAGRARSRSASRARR